MNDKRREINWKRYVIIFIITALIFLTGILISGMVNENKIEDLGEIGDKISVDILSSEIQFELLEESHCEGIDEQTTLSTELKDLAAKLNFTEKNLGLDNLEVKELKKKYTLLQIKDILLMKKMAKKCKLKPINILYFYSNEKDSCEDCKKQGYVLSKLSKDNPRLRVYSFDYNLDLAALKTLISINKIEKNLPAIVIENKVYNGFQEIKKIQKLLPKLKIEEEEKIFMEDLNGGISKIEIQCSQNSDCILNDKIFNGCESFYPVNKNTREEDISEFNKISKDFIEESGIMIKCAEKQNEEKIESVCNLESKSCEITKK